MSTNYKEALISSKGRVEQAKQQAEDLIVRIPEFEIFVKANLLCLGQTPGWGNLKP